MECIDILSCTACARTVDQWTMLPKCKRCGGKVFKLVQPTKWVLLCWFLNEPRHVVRLIIQDLREKWDEQKGKHRNTDSAGS